AKTPASKDAMAFLFIEVLQKFLIVVADQNGSVAARRSLTTLAEGAAARPVRKCTLKCDRQKAWSAQNRNLSTDLGRWAGGWSRPVRTPARQREAGEVSVRDRCNR